MTTTYHDQTTDHTRRVAVADWFDGNDPDDRFGVAIPKPDGIDDWPIYTSFAQFDCAVHIYSETGD